MKYTEDHEWLDDNDGIVTVGITEHAATQLGDVVFVDLPEVGREVTKGEEIVVIESVKAASDILAPLDGEIVEVNTALADKPGLVNEDAEAAWFFRMTTTTPEEMDTMMDEDGYADHIA